MILKNSLIFLLFTLNAFKMCPKTNHIEYNETTLTLFHSQETISDFDDFSQLNFTTCQSSVNITGLRIKPNRKIILDESLDFNGFKFNIMTQIFDIHLVNLKGIDFSLNNLNNLKSLNSFDSRAIIWHIELTNFEFYIYNKLINKNKCNFDYLFPNQSDSSFLTQIHFLILGPLLTYSDQTCPLIFHNTIIQVLSIQSVGSSFIKKNLFAFSQIPSNLIINSNIIQLIINVYHVDLSNKLLNKHVYKKLQVLDIEGQIKSIENDLFKHFKSLKFIRLRTQNAKGILLRKKNWLQSLNYDINIDLNKMPHEQIANEKFFTLVIFQMYSNVTYYDFQNKDFCNFKDFPHRKLVLPQLRPAYKSKCTCTELYLIQFSYKYENAHNNYLKQNYLLSYYYNQEYYSQEISDSTFSYCKNIENLIKRCNFTKRLELCDISTVKSIKNLDLDWYMIDWQVLSKYTFISFIFYINPLLSLLSILISMLNIKVLTSKHLKKETKCLYYYFNIHLIANIIFISAQYLDLLTECTYEDYFCSAFTNLKYLQYFKTFGLKIIKNSLTTFSNISYTSFILIRYTKITSSKNIFLKFFEKLKLKYYLLITLPFSILINIYVIFEYSIQLREYLSEVQSYRPFDSFKINISKNEKLLLNIFQYLKIIVSDLSFYLLSIFFDVSLILFIKKSINSVRSALTVGFTSKIIEKKKASKRRLTAMIILNGLNFFIFRLPLALIDLYGLIVSISLFINSKNNEFSLEYKPDLTVFLICRHFNFCDSLQKLFYSFYAFSFLIQFYIFYKLDSNFKEAIQKINFLCKRKE
jgi:hypothetical protein